MEDLIPTECECGCGAPINAGPLAVDRLRRRGLTYREIGAQLGISTQTVKMRRRQIARWAIGHRARGKWVEMACCRCGAPVRKPISIRKPPHCSGICVPMDEWRDGNCASFDLVAAGVNARIRADAARLRGCAPEPAGADAAAILAAWLSVPPGSTAGEMIAGVLAAVDDADYAAADSICHWLAEGRSLLWICETLGWPPADVCRLIARARAQSRASMMSRSSPSSQTAVVIASSAAIAAI